MLKEFLEALNNGTEYNFIATHYTEISNFNLKTILLEYICASRYVGDTARQKIYIGLKLV